MVEKRISLGEEKMKENVEHKIIFDEYTTVLLQIPKELNAVEFKGLMMRATKLFNVSQMDVIGSKTSPNQKSLLYGAKRGAKPYTKELVDKLVHYKDVSRYKWKLIAEKLNKEFGHSKSHWTYKDRYKKIKVDEATA